MASPKIWWWREQRPCAKSLLEPNPDLPILIAQRFDAERMVDLVGRVLGTATFAVALALVAATALAVRVRRRPVTEAGAVHVVIATAAMTVSLEAPPTLPLAIGCLLAGGWMVGKNRLLGYALHTAGGAVLAFTTGFPPRPLFQLAVVAFIPVAGALVARTAKLRPGITGGMALITAIGVYVTVPDTNEALALLGAALLLSPGILPASSRFGSVGGWGFVGLLVWVAVTGGFTRPGSVVGAIASLGVLLLEPVLRLMSHRWPGRQLVEVSMLGNRLVMASHCLIVFLTARLAGFQVQSEPALAISLGALVLGSILLLVPRSSSPPPPEDQRSVDTP